MKKKIYIIVLFLFLSVLFTYSLSFAENNSPAVDGMKNMLGGAENTMENMGNNIASGMNNMKAGTENMMENMTDGMDNNSNNNYNNTNYNATRTAVTQDTDGTFLGMNSTAWTWIIMALVGIAIVALVWSYAKQNDHSYND